MFYLNQSADQRNEYESFLKIVGSLSNLFSDSEVPYLYYRIAEKVFCRAFGAEDLSRSDVSADAKKNDIGIWLKTFLAWNHKSFQKVAEFNNDKPLYEKLNMYDLVRKISELRNTRIKFAEDVHALDASIYHCVIREKGRFLLYEETMDKIDIENIKNIRENKWSISFDDWKNDYSFLLSKSTLTKRFLTSPIAYDFWIDIIEDPLDELHSLLTKKQSLLKQENRVLETLYLPLYWRDYKVHERSGLNQWNARGRDRNLNEVYIPIPAEIHRNYPAFFPNRDTRFQLKLPNGKTMQCKICQDWGKALMSYSNKELWERILRDVLNLKEWELLTYERLQVLGIDSVRIDKIDSDNFEINFSASWSYDRFKSNFM